MTNEAQLKQYPEQKLVDEFQRLYLAVFQFSYEQGMAPDFKKLLGLLLHTTKSCMVQFATTENEEFQEQMEASFKFIDTVFMAMIDMPAAEYDREGVNSFKLLLRDYYEGIFSEPVWKEMRAGGASPQITAV